MKRRKQDTLMPPFPGEGEKMTDELKYYGIETKNGLADGYSSCYGTDKHRYFSLYNGARGIWHKEKELATTEGEAHKALIIALHGK